MGARPLMLGKDCEFDAEEVVRVALHLDAHLAREQGAYYDDPLGWVKHHFPWGQEGTILEDQDGPDSWQTEQLTLYGDSIKERAFNGKDPVDPFRSAVASGHGIGKSALVAWLVLFILSTRPHCKGIITANTMPQLATKTWSELAKWHRMCITGRWFKMTSGIGAMKLVHREHPETWRVDAMTCAKENSDAFQGLHAATSTPFYVFDEASNIPEQIWEVSQGGLTDGEPAWWAFGNPTRNSGSFFACFHGFAHRWNLRQIDSRDAKMSNKKLLEEWLDDYGEDSDFFRVRCRGVFPSLGEKQLISQKSVFDARRREAIAELAAPLIIGVDVAREPAGDETVIAVRKGLDARTHEMQAFRGVDATWIAERVGELDRKLRADAIFIDATGGWGGAVVDILIRQGHTNVFGIKFGGRASSPKSYANKRSEMWVRMRDGLDNGLAIEDSDQLEQELVAPTYDYNRVDALILERKRDIKVRLGPSSSPDRADALALTYARHVVPRENAGGRPRHAPRVSKSHDPWAGLASPPWPGQEQAAWYTLTCRHRWAYPGHTFADSMGGESHVLQATEGTRGQEAGPCSDAARSRCGERAAAFDLEDTFAAGSPLHRLDWSAWHTGRAQRQQWQPGWWERKLTHGCDGSGAHRQVLGCARQGVHQLQGSPPGSAEVPAAA